MVMISDRIPFTHLELRVIITHLELRVITKYALCVIVGHSLSTSRRSDWWSIIAPSPQPVGLGSLSSVCPFVTLLFGF